jgi:hypothetical protein
LKRLRHQSHDLLHWHQANYFGNSTIFMGIHLGEILESVFERPLFAHRKFVIEYP